MVSVRRVPKVEVTRPVPIRVAAEPRTATEAFMLRPKEKADIDTDQDSCTTVPESPAGAPSIAADVKPSFATPTASPDAGPPSLPLTDTTPGSVDTRLIRRLRYNLDMGGVVALDCLWY